MPIYQLLVRTVDKVNTDPKLDIVCLKRGDVVVIKPAETAWWTEKEQNNPEWTIIKAELTEEQAASLTAPELPPDLNNKYEMLKRRAINLNLDELPKGDLVIEQTLISSAIELKERTKELWEI